MRRLTAIDTVFDQIETQQGIVYGSNIGSSGLMEQLDMDIYLPAGDVATHRPRSTLAHGGFFLAGSNDGTDVVPLREDLASHGVCGGVDELPAVASTTCSISKRRCRNRSFAGFTMPAPSGLLPEVTCRTGNLGHRS